MPSKVLSALRSRSTASCERRSGKPARSWRWLILAVVLVLFAHQEALAQSALSALSLTPGALDPVFDPAADPEQRNFTAEVAFGVTQVTVEATAAPDWEVTYQGAADADTGTAGYQRDLRLGANTITVRATSTADPPEAARNYTITVRRAAEIGSALSGLTLSAGTLDPVFDAAEDDRTFTADVALSVTTLTVTATAKPGWEVTYHDDPDADTGTDGYQRSLAEGANRITVRATPTGASGLRNHTITVTRTTTPGAPRNLGAAAADRSVRLTWTAPSSDGGMDITGYDYRSKDADDDDGQWMDDDEWSAITGSDDSTTSYDVGSLTNGTTYLFQVRARNANSNTDANTDPQGSASNTAEATPARPLPAPVWTTTDPLPIVEGNQRVTLSWTRIPDATTSTEDDASVTGYQYQWRVDGGSYGGWTTIADADLEQSGITRSYTVTGLNNGTTYFFQVRGRNSVGGGAASTEREGTPEADRPGAPTNLRATAGDEQVALSWTAPSDNGGEPITGYEYRYRPQDDATYDDTDNPWTATGGTGTTATVHDLDNGTTYYFQVRAVNDLGCSATKLDGCGQASLEASATPFGTPETRVSLDMATPGDRRVRLTWSPDPTQTTLPADDRSGFQYRQDAGGGYGSWIDVRNSSASTTTHVVGSLDNGTTYTFQVRAVNSSGGGLASNERSAVPSTTPGAPTNLTATAGDEQVNLTWTPPDDGGMRISRYLCQRRSGAGAYGPCTARSISGSATSLTLTDDDVPPIANDTTYTFQVRAENGNGEGDWSNEASARPTDSPGTGRSYTISATVNGKSWAKATEPSPLRATVEVNPRFTAQSTTLWVGVSGAATAGDAVEFGPTNSRRDASFTVTPSSDAGDITVALFMSETDASTPTAALAATSVEVRPDDTPDPPTGLVATRGDGEVTLSWATPPADQAVTDYEYRQRRQAGSYGRWTDFAGDEFRRGTGANAVTSNTVTGLTDGGTYAFQVRALTATAGAASAPSDEVSVSLSGTPPRTGPLSAPRNLTATAGNGQVTLRWAAPQSGAASITRYEYRRETTRNAGGGGTWTTTRGTGTTFTVTGLANGTRYYFRVRAVNSDGPGPESSEASATPARTAGGSLSALTLSGVALSPAFAPATRDYTASVGNSVAQVTVTATPSRGTAAITPGDDDTTEAGHQVDLRVGTTTITVTVTDGSVTGRYTIIVTRAGSRPDTDTTLSALVLSNGTLTPSFAPAVRSYTATVDGSVSQITVTATANKSGVPVVIAPADANAGAAGHQVNLGVGTTTITVTVTDGSATGAYAVRVTRTGRVPATPTGLTASAGDGEVVLSWAAPASNSPAITSYQYQQKAGAGAYGPWTSIPDSSSTTRSHVVTGLANGTTYAFRVRAVNDTGAGGASNEATATPAVARLVRARTEAEVADAITAAKNAAFGDDREFTRGEAIVVMGDALFEAAEGVRVLYTASSSDDDVASASVSGAEFTVTAGATGTADITVTAHATTPSGVEILDQTDPREAGIVFTVDVGFEALTIALSGPAAETNVVEGGRTHANGTLGTVTVTATANRPVTGETTVMLRRDRGDSTAGDDDFAADPIVIAAGETAGSTVVTAVEDNTPEDREELVLFGVTADNSGEVTGEIRLYLWDAAVPALPVIAQLLLAAFLAIGGYRRYRRR